MVDLEAPGAQLTFTSRLVGLPVHAPDGPPIGQLFDVVASAQGVGAPHVLGFVTSVPGRRIFVSAGRVTGLSADGVRLGTASVNLRPFAQRASELLLAADVVDHRVGADRINDVALAPTRRHGWEVVAAHLVPARRLPWSARGAKPRLVPWAAVAAAFAPGPDDPFAELRHLHPVELARRLHGMAEVERTRAVLSLADADLANALEELPEDVQAELLPLLGVERGADVLEEMEPDDAADLLSELDTQARDALLAAMEPDESRPVLELLRHHPDSAGGLMNPEPILLGPDATVADALARVRNPDLSPCMAGQVFVVEPPTETPTGTFLGTCHVQRLLREPPSTPLRGLATLEHPVPVTPAVATQEVAAHLAAYNLLAWPVCDADGRLLGAVTVDDVLDRLLPPDWREDA